MLKNIIIQNYRGIKDLEIKDFKRINLLVGDNNSGKTSALEAIFALLSPTNPLALANIINKKRGEILINAKSGQETLDILSDDFWNGMTSIFNEKNTKNAISISSEDKTNKSKSKKAVLEISYNQDSKSFVKTNLIAESQKNFIFNFTSEDGKKTETGFSNVSGNHFSDPAIKKIFGLTVTSMLFAEPKRANDIFRLLEQYCSSLSKKQEILKILQNLEPNLTSFDINNYIHCYFKGVNDVNDDYKLPINHLGDGIRSILATIVNIAKYSGGACLLDEIENGLHYKSQKLMWQQIFNVSKSANTQIFATTHSYEMIKSLVELCEDGIIDEKEIMLYSLDKKAGKNYVSTFDGKSLDGMISSGGEVR